VQEEIATYVPVAPKSKLNQSLQHVHFQRKLRQAFQNAAHVTAKAPKTSSQWAPARSIPWEQSDPDTKQCTMKRMTTTKVNQVQDANQLKWGL